MKISQTRFAILLGCMVLPACGGDGSQLSGSKSVSSISTPSPAPTATPTPAPTATPTPTPSPTPTPTSAAASLPPSSKDDGKTIIVAEGDSISIDYAGFYTGYFGLEHPGVEYYVHAVSGSTVRKLVERQQEVLNRNADIVTVFIGANDLGGYESGRAFYDALMNYVGPLRADGSKVYVATVLPRTAGAHTAWNDNHNRIRSEVADLLRAGVGNQLDGIIDFGGHPTIGSVSATYNLQLYKDGLHPTDRNWKGSTGGHDYMYEVYNKAIEQAIVDLQR